MNGILHIWILAVFVIIVISNLHDHHVYGNEKFCPATLNAVLVSSCPVDEQSWGKAAIKRNCSSIKQDCVEPYKLEYHCLLNHFMTDVYEVCAPARYINLGFCGEYNVKGGKIQENYQSDCKVFLKPCSLRYLSTEIYKYPDCLKKTNISTPDVSSTVQDTTLLYWEPTTSSNQNSNETLTIILPLVIIIIVIIIDLTLLSYIVWKRREKMHRNATDVTEANINRDIGEEMTSVPLVPSSFTEDESAGLQNVQLSDDLSLSDSRSNKEQWGTLATMCDEKSFVEYEHKESLIQLDDEDAEITDLKKNTVSEMLPSGREFTRGKGLVVVEEDLMPVIEVKEQIPEESESEKQHLLEVLDNAVLKLSMKISRSVTAEKQDDEYQSLVDTLQDPYFTADTTALIDFTKKVKHAVEKF